MKKISLIVFILICSNVMGQNAKAVTEKKTFSRTTRVPIGIDADPATIWSLLTTAPNFPNWNSTVLALDGEIKVGEKIRLTSYLDPSRVFKIKIKEMDPQKSMVWGDSMGNRVYTLEKADDGTVIFTMTEKIGSFMFPLFANKIPSFDESFEKFATDLKTAAEEKN